ncbi:MAG: SusD/RagB family nutrient-binding outer membrane lipoprotein [Clostridia bacterium]|nr:SusD/RagB family nutrient-binding outer membrane lipoprotein [Clostridia bacterium]
MKKIILALIVLIGFSTSCTKDFDEYNVDTKRPTMVPPEMLFANAQKALADQVASTNVNLNVWKLFVQYWTETTYTDEANYDIINRNIAQLAFRTYYRDILRDLKEARILTEAIEPITPEETTMKNNQLMIIELLTAYSYNRLLDTFGNIPYTEALNIDDITPAYDDAAFIYGDLMARTKNAVAGLDGSAGSFGGYDLYFNGDVMMWKKFGNSLLIKLAITVSKADWATAKAVIEGAYNDGPLFEMGELAELVYIGGSNSNPLYQDLVQSGRDDFVIANTLVDKMEELADPRREAYFTFAPDTNVYIGGPYGENNPFNQYSHIAPRIQEPTFPITLMDYTETQFYLAEAALRGAAVGSAEEHYANAIASSFQHWGVGGAAAYIAANPLPAENWQEVLGTQAWIAYYIRGLVSYTTWRRLGYPTLNMPPRPPESAEGAVPRRFTYPVNEQTLNKENYYAAVAAMGSDKLSTRIFWDIP